MIRTTHGKEFYFDSEIEKTVKKLRKEAKAVKRALNSITLTEEFDNLFDLSGLFAEEGPSLINMAEEKTLKELDAPPIQQAPLCITAANLQAPLELKSGLIHLLPKFRRLANEDPYNHWKEFHVVCSSMKPDRITEGQIKLRAFPFSLEDTAKKWLFYLPAGSITSWEKMMKMFLERYYPASRVYNVSFPQHGIPEQAFINFFYEGLLPSARSSINGAAGGSLVEKILSEAKRLIEIVASTSRQFGERQEGVNESITYPEGKIEDVLVKVDKFIIILDFEADKDVPIILGRPFLATGRTLIDVQKGELTMRVLNEQVTFNVFKAMKHLDDVEECSRISVIDTLTSSEFINHSLNPLETALVLNSKDLDETTLEQIGIQEQKEHKGTQTNGEIQDMAPPKTAASPLKRKARFYDRCFASPIAENRYNRLFSQSTTGIQERGLELDPEGDPDRSMIDTVDVLHWVDFIKHPTTAGMLSVVQEFYANFANKDAEERVFVRGKRVAITRRNH
ncbi:DNA-directed DNA polymerase [Senna tora]|uniref:DNA-directed DNA polymerase n=1 Tax=Senna tora TaxID=362788 RepID=A0A834TNG4_9FABA|nr:DNA-directed DNA polymerase [Senna tora]